MPKEVRNPKSKSEVPNVFAGVLGEDSVFWGWGTNSEEDVLREGGDAGRPPSRDLMERTAEFGEAIIRFCKKVPRSSENNRLIGQLVGAATRVGANYCEADDAVSGKDFTKSIGVCRKESKEAMFFLRMMAASEPALTDDARRLWREAKELNLIFGAIWRKQK